MSDLLGRIVDASLQNGRPLGIIFRAWEPFSRSTSANYELTGIRGRSTPHVSYVDTGEEVWSCNAQLTTGGRESEEEITVEGLHDHVEFVRSFVYPDYSGGLVVKPPPLCLISLGTTWKKIGYLQGVQDSHEAPYDVITGLSMNVKLTFELHVTQTRPLGMQDVRDWRARR